MSDDWEVVKIRSTPVGWAQIEIGTSGRVYVDKLLIHKDHTSVKDTSMTFGVTDKDPTGPHEPTEPGFYRCSLAAGQASLIFALKHDGSWSVWSGPDPESATKCEWSYVRSFLENSDQDLERI